MYNKIMNTEIKSIKRLIDQEERDRFAQEVDTNFSVIAPAGVGKTTAIVQRITNIAATCDCGLSPTKLSKLVVVTYTQKAADEMRQRSYQELLRTSASPVCLREFNKAFFGTIHSFCLRIIQSYGTQIGIPSNVSLLSDDDDLWHEFLNTNDSFSKLVPAVVKTDLYKHINLSKLVYLARKVRPQVLIKETLCACPEVNLNAVFNHSSTRSEKKVLAIQKELKNWWTEYQKDPFFLEIPTINQGDSDFKEMCAEAFSPLWNWLGSAALSFVTTLSKEYQKFRVAKGLITYDDMVELAANLLKDPYVARTIRALDYHVILDEAQDTDANQFAVLLDVSRSDSGSFPNRGRFSMLGDPQQAIYSSRADLPTYLKIHNDLLDSDAAETLIFTVTMRCNREIVRHCNALFPSILKSKIAISQTDFVPLSPRPWAEEGFVGKIRIELPQSNGLKLNTDDLEKHEASVLALKIRNLGHQGLNVGDWNEVAILTPRKSWLVSLAKAFEDVGIPSQIQSRNDIKGDDPAFAWLTALLVVISSPNDSFEITGVLREVFALSDDAIACFVHWWNKDKNTRHPLNIAFKEDGNAKDIVGRVLDLLYEVRIECSKLSLSEAVRHIIEKVQLRSRLASLPQYRSEELFDSLDKLLIKATLAEEQSNSLEQFAEALKKDYNTSDDSITELKGHIQLYTSHKAKGLEWSVVIVPFLFRDILFPPQEYPQLIDLGSLNEPKIAVCNHPDKREFDELLQQHRIAELERLLYVTATRARGTLLWVDDEDLFVNSKNSFASLLNIRPGGINREIWNELSPPISQSSMAKESCLEDSPVEAVLDYGVPFDPASIPEAKIRSKAFLHRIIPSHLSSSSNSLNSLKRPSKNYSPVEYGNWWHKMMEKLPWNNQAAWDAHLEQRLSECPEPLRGKSEFLLFQNSPLAEMLCRDRFAIYTELPFLYKNADDTCCEGFIDLFAYCAESESLIIDWKTDLFELEWNSLETLKDAYSAQLGVYKEAIKKTYKISPKTFIFSTALGGLVQCHP